MTDAPLPAANASANPPLSRAVILAVLAASLMVGAFAISTQSYWIDEATSLLVAMAKDPAEAWKYARAVGGSTIQMPLYHLYLYAWHKMFGGGEWVMRASNLPWFVLGQLAFLLVLRQKPKLALTACLLAAISPTVWMYLDEARPYLMQYAAACWLAAIVVRLSSAQVSQPSELSPRLPLVTHPPILIAAVSSSSVIFFDAGPLGIVWLTGFIAAFAWLWITQVPAAPGTASPAFRPPAPARSAIIVIVFVTCCLAISAWYFWTSPMAGGGYSRPGANLFSLPYIAYEFLGFSGYGPGKLQLRTSLAESLAQRLPALLPLAILLAALAVFLLLHTAPKNIRRRTIIAWLLALALPSLVTLAGFFLASYRPLPRHFIPALPPVILGLAAILGMAFAQKQLVWRAAAVLLPLLWLGSSLDLRWRADHAKDDYRTAAAFAAAALADNKEVWWAADAAAAYIYLTPVALEEMPGRVWAMQAPAWDNIRFKFPPRVIVISKPDIYDPQGAVARYASENQFAPALQLQAFTILTRHGEPLPQPAR